MLVKRLSVICSVGAACGVQCAAGFSVPDNVPLEVAAEAESPIVSVDKKVVKARRRNKRSSGGSTTDQPAVARIDGSPATQQWTRVLVPDEATLLKAACEAPSEFMQLKKQVKETFPNDFSVVPSGLEAQLHAAMSDGPAAKTVHDAVKLLTARLNALMPCVAYLDGFTKCLTAETGLWTGAEQADLYALLSRHGKTAARKIMSAIGDLLGLDLNAAANSARGRDDGSKPAPVDEVRWTYSDIPHLLDAARLPGEAASSSLDAKLAGGKLAQFQCGMAWPAVLLEIYSKGKRLTQHTGGPQLLPDDLEAELLSLADLATATPPQTVREAVELLRSSLGRMVPIRQYAEEQLVTCEFVAWRLEIPRDERIFEALKEAADNSFEGMLPAVAQLVNMDLKTVRKTVRESSLRLRGIDPKDSESVDKLLSIDWVPDVLEQLATPPSEQPGHSLEAKLVGSRLAEYSKAMASLKAFVTHFRTMECMNPLPPALWVAAQELNAKCRALPLDETVPATVGEAVEQLKKELHHFIPVVCALRAMSKSRLFYGPLAPCECRKIQSPLSAFGKAIDAATGLTRAIRHLLAVDINAVLDAAGIMEEKKRDWRNGGWNRWRKGLNVALLMDVMPATAGAEPRAWRMYTALEDSAAQVGNYLAECRAGGAATAEVVPMLPDALESALAEAASADGAPRDLADVVERVKQRLQVVADAGEYYDALEYTLRTMHLPLAAKPDKFRRIAWHNMAQGFDVAQEVAPHLELLLDFDFQKVMKEAREKGDQVGDFDSRYSWFNFDIADVLAVIPPSPGVKATPDLSRPRMKLFKRGLAMSFVFAEFYKIAKRRVGAARGTTELLTRDLDARAAAVPYHFGTPATADEAIRLLRKRIELITPCLEHAERLLRGGPLKPGTGDWKDEHHRARLESVYQVGREAVAAMADAAVNLRTKPVDELTREALVAKFAGWTVADIRDLLKRVEVLA